MEKSNVKFCARVEPIIADFIPVRHEADIWGREENSFSFVKKPYVLGRKKKH